MVAVVSLHASRMAVQMLCRSSSTPEGLLGGEGEFIFFSRLHRDTVATAILYFLLGKFSPIKGGVIGWEQRQTMQLTCYERAMIRHVQGEVMNDVAKFARC